jgi:transketolase
MSDFELNRELLRGQEVAGVSTREAFGQEIVRLAEANQDIVVVNADLVSSLKLGEFAKKFPQRLIQVGVAEQNMAGVALGLANYGKIPFITSFAAFSPGLNWSQIRLAAQSNANIKVISSHYGLNIGEDGASAQMLEDLAIMRVLPNFEVITPADSIQTKEALAYAAGKKGPVYIRLTREAYPVIYRDDYVFKPGAADVLSTGSSATLVATGTMVATAINIAQILAERGKSLEVINLHTVKPLDAGAIIASLLKTGKLITLEEHQLAAGMGSAVLESITGKVKIDRYLGIGCEDRFGQSGSKAELLAHYGLDEQSILRRITEFL